MMQAPVNQGICVKEACFGAHDAGMVGWSVRVLFRPWVWKERWEMGIGVGFEASL